MLDLIKRNRTFFIPYFLLLIAMLIIQLYYGNPKLTFWINSKHELVFDPLFKFFTSLGEGTIGLFLAAILIFIRFGKAVVALVISNVAGLLAQLLKHTLFSKTMRPAVYFLHHHPGLHFVPGVPIFHDQSFPSGHSTTAFSIAALLSMFSKSKNASYFFLALAICVGWSRMYLGEHFFTDVMGGATLGGITSLICYYFVEKSTLPQKRWYQLNLQTILLKHKQIKKGN